MVSTQRRILGSAAAALFACSLFTGAAPAGAVDLSAQDTCLRGEVCVYNGNGTLIWSSQGNLDVVLPQFEGGGKIRNNGWPDPGKDHIRYQGVSFYGDEIDGCLHYPNDDEPTEAVIWNNAYITKITWIGAC
ncbi:hypothetical protein [Glycomyces sp. NPDC047010]|uniref:hypothetical protein n=1 Tax=Glycomyces sp. NPDC047010 TaxID=3155023 RepID=UPI0033E83B9C